MTKSLASSALCVAAGVGCLKAALAVEQGDVGEGEVLHSSWEVDDHETRPLFSYGADVGDLYRACARVKPVVLTIAVGMPEETCFQLASVVLTVTCDGIWQLNHLD